MKNLLPAFIACAAFAFALGLRAQSETPAASAYHAKFVDALGKYAMSVDGKPDTAALKTKKYLFVYYSAHWCQPCKIFTPKLVAFYDKNYASGDFGVIFVSYDHSKSEMKGYMKEAGMPWVGVESDSKPGRALSKLYTRTGIPCLILLDENDKVVAENHGANSCVATLKTYEKLRKSAK